MKQWIRSFLLLSLLSTPSTIFADTLSLTTYYPAPFGSYSILRLNPSTDASMGACDATKTGQLYMSSDSGELKICNGTSWNSAGPWTHVIASKFVYLYYAVSDTAYKVGIGLNAPLARFHVRGLDDATHGQLRVESTQSDAKLTLYNSSGATTTGNASLTMSNTVGSEGLRFMINNVDEMILDETGNVGIGVVAPNTTLHLSGADNATYGQLEIQSTGNDARLSLYNANGAAATGRGDIMMSRTAGSEGLRFLINNADRMIIDETGNVGIGEVAPAEELSIRRDQAGASTIAKVTNASAVANSLAAFQLITGTVNSLTNHALVETGSAPYYVIQTADGVTAGMFFVAGSTLTNIPIIFRQGATERIRIHSDGNVGVGVAAPTQKLDVSGGLHLAGPINGNIDSVNAGASGTLRVNCLTSPGNCYAVYAP